MKQYICLALLHLIVFTHAFGARCSSDQYLDEQTNTCKYTAKYIAKAQRGLQLQQNANACAEIEDVQESRKCYVDQGCENNSSDPNCQKFNDCMAEHPNNYQGYRGCMMTGNQAAAFSGLGIAAAVTTLTLSGIALLVSLEDMKEGSKCREAYSAWMMAAGGAALIGSEVAAFMMFNNDSKEIYAEAQTLLMSNANSTDDDGTATSTENSGDLQKEAFSLMIKQEEANKKSMTTKVVGYSIAAAAFSAAAITATVEAIQAANAKANGEPEKICEVTASSDSPSSSTSPPPSDTGNDNYDSDQIYDYNPAGDSSVEDGFTQHMPQKALDFITGIFLGKQAHAKEKGKGAMGYLADIAMQMLMGQLTKSMSAVTPSSQPQRSYADAVMNFNEKVAFSQGKVFEYDEDFHKTLKEIELNFSIEEREELSQSLALVGDLIKNFLII